MRGMPNYKGRIVVEAIFELCEAEARVQDVLLFSGVHRVLGM